MLFSGFLQFNHGNFVDAQNNLKYPDLAPLKQKGFTGLFKIILWVRAVPKCSDLVSDMIFSWIRHGNNC